MAYLYCDLIDFNKRHFLQISEEKPSLLVLNDDCLFKIFKFLELSDYVNLAKTCDRLLNVAKSDNKFKYIEVLITSEKHRVGRYLEDAKEHAIMLSNNEFADILSVVGRQLLSIKIYFVNVFVLRTLSDNCANLKSIEVDRSLDDGGYFFKKLNLHCLKNLKELKLSNCEVRTSELKNCFRNNPDIESFKDCKCRKDEDFMELLQLLPKLNKLELFVERDEQVQHLLNLDGLTKLSFHSNGKCNNILSKLATKTNLVELKFSVYFYLLVDLPNFDDTFTIIKSFRNLQVLSITNSDIKYSDDKNFWAGLPEKTVLPPNLKYIKLCAIWMTCDNFLSIVEQLNFLEEFDLGRAAIVWKQFSHPSQPNKFHDKIISRIVNQLKQRSLKVIYPTSGSNEATFLYNSDRLKIVSLDCNAFYKKVQFERKLSDFECWDSGCTCYVK